MCMHSPNQPPSQRTNQPRKQVCLWWLDANLDIPGKRNLSWGIASIRLACEHIRGWEFSGWLSNVEGPSFTVGSTIPVQMGPDWTGKVASRVTSWSLFQFLLPSSMFLPGFPQWWAVTCKMEEHSSPQSCFWSWYFSQQQKANEDTKKWNSPVFSSFLLFDLSISFPDSHQLSFYFLFLREDLSKLPGLAMHSLSILVRPWTCNPASASRAAGVTDLCHQALQEATSYFLYLERDSD